MTQEKLQTMTTTTTNSNNANNVRQESTRSGGSRSSKIKLHRNVVIGIGLLCLVLFFMTQSKLLMEMHLSESSIRTLEDVGFGRNFFSNNGRSKPPKESTPKLLTQQELLDRTLEKHQSFAACLMVMDENHRLPEWIAYHYHVLPLRHLVIHEDPRSVTNVSDVLNEWRTTLSNDMSFEEWTEYDFTSNDKERASFTVVMDASYNARLNAHRQRQSSFYRACGIHLHKQGYKWVAFHDADEFLTLSNEYFDRLPRNTGINNTSNHTPQKAQDLMIQPGSVLQVLTKMRTPGNTEYIYSHFHQPQSYAHAIDTPCFNIPRARYSSLDISMEERNQFRLTNPNIKNETSAQTLSSEIVSSQKINTTNLVTMRFRIRETARDNMQNAGKSFIDVSQMNLSTLKPRKGNAHRPYHDMCPPHTFETYGALLPFGIHHYYGTLEAHLYKSDARGKEMRLRQFESGALLGDRRKRLKSFRDDDELCSWLSGFVNDVGLERAEYLLRNAQKLPPPPPQEEET